MQPSTMQPSTMQPSTMQQSTMQQCTIAVVIPCYRVKEHIFGVLARIGQEVHRIYLVDDHCPQNTGKMIQEQCTDTRVQVLFNPENRGVGGATIAGYRAALRDGADVIVKIDGDGQMDPQLISRFIAPIISGEADYTKGNRFFQLESLSSMPTTRLIGNAALSFISKASSGYWDLMDPTNGYTAIAAEVARMLPLDKLDNRYFFESDMLFRLNTSRAVVREIPMEAVYQQEQSSLRISSVLLDFPGKHLVRLIKRIFYNYFLRDFSVCSLQLIMGLLCCGAGLIFGIDAWRDGSIAGVPASTGTVMLAALPIILGFQLLLAALSYDVMNVPRIPLVVSLQRRGGGTQLEGLTVMHGNRP